eukprot:scaffold1058_cov155-Ochromonas_danica.AAC.23
MKNSKTRRRRGNLEEFYDPKVQELLKAPIVATHSSGKHNFESKARLTASWTSGQLCLNPQLLKEECENVLQDRWFLKDQERLHPARFKPVDLFQVGSVVRPATAFARERKDHLESMKLPESDTSSSSGITHAPTYSSSVLWQKKSKK